MPFYPRQQGKQFPRSALHAGTSCRGLMNTDHLVLISILRTMFYVAEYKATQTTTQQLIINNLLPCLASMSAYHSPKSNGNFPF